MSHRLDSIIIVGGGTAGWITAALLAARLGTGTPGGVAIRLIESSDIATIGVGEGTFPTLRRTLRQIGVGEAEFMRACSATFKQAIKFVDWVRPPRRGEHSHYYHPFNVPHVMPMAGDMTAYWLLGLAGDRPWSAAATLQDCIVDGFKAPKRIDDAPYEGPMNYAYHLDAARLGDFLKTVALARGVGHIVDTVERVELDEHGAISGLRTSAHGTLNAGLYVDCTGFAGLLLGRALGEPWRDVGSTLFVDRAVTMQVPYPDDTTPIIPATVSTAHEAGWTWDIGLDTRRGIGYCYSSAHSDDDRAEEVLRAYVGAQAEKLSARRLQMRIGFRDRQWVKNCVAVGLSAGFLEPLEATGIIQIEAAAHMIAEYFPRNGQMQLVAKHFSHIMRRRYECAVDFLKLHYFLSQRSDHAFWIDNRNPRTASDALLEKLEMWRSRPPSYLDFDTSYEAFKCPSYQYILYGMGFRPDLQDNESAYPYRSQAQFEFDRVQRASRQALAALPDHRALVRAIYRSGLRPTNRSTAVALDTTAMMMHR